MAGSHFLSHSDACKTCATVAIKISPQVNLHIPQFLFLYQWSHQHTHQSAGNLCCHQSCSCTRVVGVRNIFLWQRRAVNPAVLERPPGRYTMGTCSQRRDALVSWWRSCRMLTDLAVFKEHCSMCVGPRWYSDYPPLQQVRKTLQKFRLLRLRFNTFCKMHSSLHGKTDSKY